MRSPRRSSRLPARTASGPTACAREAWCRSAATTPTCASHNRPVTTTTMRVRSNAVLHEVISFKDVSQGGANRNATDSAIRQPLNGTLRLKPQDPPVSRMARVFSLTIVPPDDYRQTKIARPRSSNLFEDFHSIARSGSRNMIPRSQTTNTNGYSTGNRNFAGRTDRHQRPRRRACGRFLSRCSGAEVAVQAGPGLAFFDCGGVRLMLTRPEKPEFDHPSSILYFAVPDIQAAHASDEGEGRAL